MQYWLEYYYYTVITFFFLQSFFIIIFSLLIGHRNVVVGCLRLAEETFTPGCSRKHNFIDCFDELKMFKQTLLFIVFSIYHIFVLTLKFLTRLQRFLLNMQQLEISNK